MHPIIEQYNKINNFGRLLNLKIEEIEPGSVVYSMTIAEKHLSNPQAVHGGAVAGMMDAILGVAALSVAVEKGRLVSTVEFKINYFHPVRLGDVLLGTGEVIFSGNHLLSSSGKIIRQSDKRLIATGIGTFNQYPASKNPGLNLNV